VPENKTVEGWAIERVTLAYSIAGYLWFYGDDTIETLATEVQYDLPLRGFAGRALPGVRRVGKIDQFVRYNGRPLICDYKSTGKPIDSDASIWDRLRLSTQAKSYIVAARELQVAGDLEKYGIKRDEPLISGFLFDLWHKPGISPKMLTQADSKAFVESGDYCGQKFEITTKQLDQPDGSAQFPVIVDGVRVELEPGKKPGTFALRETPDMYGARLLADITERPGFYFARREIPFTDADLAKHDQEVLNIYQSMRMMDKGDFWWHNESQCENTFRCQYTPICYHDLPVFDGTTTPPGFKRIFGDLNKAVTTEE
jgi:hypothetical protein